MKFVGIPTHPYPADGIIYHQVDERLIQAIENVGLSPVLIPMTELPNLSDYFTRLDGLILAGRTSVSPFYYGEEPSQSTGQLNLALDQFELTLIKEAIGTLPILGIERGCHLLNVAFGGTLAPVDSKVIHHGSGNHYHSLNLRKRSQLHELYGSRMIVLSRHSERIGELATKLQSSAKSVDGVIEAFEHPSLPIIGVQFPLQEMSEFMCSLLLQTFSELK